jgi:hypothetical protein
MLDQLEDRAAELEADNHALRRRVATLDSERDELANTLDAARAMNRELMNQINRQATAPTELPAVISARQRDPTEMITTPYCVTYVRDTATPAIKGTIARIPKNHRDLDRLLHQRPHLRYRRKVVPARSSHRRQGGDVTTELTR